MSREVRVFAEGALRFAQASGTGGFNTASGATTALVGFVQAGLKFNSAANVATVKERGVPHHFKKLGFEPVDVTFSYFQALTANLANPGTASGVSTKQMHFELKINEDEGSANSAFYYQFTNGMLISRGWTEAEQGDVFQENWKFLYMTGPTGSGYIA